MELSSSFKLKLLIRRRLCHVILCEVNCEITQFETKRSALVSVKERRSIRSILGVQNRAEISL